MTTTDVVFTFWNETWSDAVQRQFMPPDRLAQALLTHDRVGKLLVANDFRSGPTQLIRYLMGRRAAPFPTRPDAALVSPLRLRRRDSIGEHNLSRSYEAYDRRLARQVASRGLHKPAVITTNPFVAAYAPMAWAGPVTYYAWDDWAALPALERWWPDFNRAYEKIRQRGRRACAVSPNLLNRLAPTGAGAVVPNGIETSEWQPPWAIPAWAEALPRPCIAYVGAIQDRLDTDAIRQVAERLPDATIFVVGPVLDPRVPARLAGLPNIRVKPALDRAEVAGFIHSVDLCIMPHHITPLTLSMSPLKLYEYCAAGRPVVATALPPVRDIHEKVHLVEQGDSFADAVERALSEGPMPESDRQIFLERNSWTRRHEEILDLALAP